MGPPDQPRRVRLFVALDLPDRVTGELVAWQRAEVTPRAELRAVRPEALHITLCFLGHLPEVAMDGVVAAVEAACEGRPAPRLRLEPEPVGVPSRGRPRLFALGLRGEGAEELRSEVSARLETAGLYEPEPRPFWAHVTVCRVRAERRGARRPARVDSPPGALPVQAREPFDAVRVTVYRSTLRPTGAEYEPLAMTALRVPEPR